MPEFEDQPREKRKRGLNFGGIVDFLLNRNQRDETRVPTEEMREEEDLPLEKEKPKRSETLSQGNMIAIAEATQQPTRFQIASNVTWLNRDGRESFSPQNSARFEEMLRRGELKGFDDLEPSIRDYVTGTVLLWAAEIGQPIKINDLWWDAQGNRVSEQNFARFEERASGFQED